MNLRLKIIYINYLNPSKLQYTYEYNLTCFYVNNEVLTVTNLVSLDTISFGWSKNRFK